MRIFKKIEKGIVYLNMGVVVLSLTGMIVLGLVQIILRNVFNSGIPSADIIIRNLVLWVGFAGAVVATSRGRHIAIGALLKVVPEKFKRIAHVITSLFTSVVCFFLAHASVRFVLFEAELGEKLTDSIPLWSTEIIIPATFIFLAYMFFIHAFEAPSPEEGEPI